MITEIVYLGRENTNDLLLKADGAAQDLSSVTRMTLTFDSTVIDSSESPGVFDWNTGTTGKLVLALGSESVAVGIYRARLIVYDPTNPDGIVWGELNLAFKS